MNKKGFSLVEIIAVIALIAIISTVVIVNMTGVQQNTNETEIKRFSDKISSAACQYVDRGSDLVLSTSTDCSANTNLTTRDDCKENSGGCYVCLKTLIEEGLIDKDTIDPNNNKKLSEEQTAVRVKVKWVDDGGAKKKVCTFEGDDVTPTPIAVGAKKRKIFFDYNGGTGTETSRERTVDAEFGTLPTGTNTGYMIDYWYYNGDESRHANSTDKMGESDVLLVAHWVPAIYSVSLVTNGGTINSGNITSYQGGTGATLPTNVTKTGHNFAGWYDNSSFSGSPVTSISASDSGNKTYYAKWNVTSVYCSSGYYLPGNSVSCSYCPSNSYCSGGTFSFSSSDQGRYYCSSLGYSYSNSGSTSASSCYISVSGGYYKVSSTGYSTSQCTTNTYRDSHYSYYGYSDSCYSCNSGTTSGYGASYCSSCSNSANVASWSYGCEIYSCNSGYEKKNNQCVSKTCTYYKSGNGGFVGKYKCKNGTGTLINCYYSLGGQKFYCDGGSTNCEGSGLSNCACSYGYSVAAVSGKFSKYCTTALNSWYRSYYGYGYDFDITNGNLPRTESCLCDDSLIEEELLDDSGEILLG